MNIIEAKTELRKHMRARRNALSVEQGADFSRRIGERLRAMESVRNAETIAAYLATLHETSLDEAILRWLHEKTVVVPSLGLKPRFDVLESLENVKTNARGLRVPLSNRKIAAPEIGVIVVPALAFDFHGNRLGQGGGWYDRVLDRARDKGKPLVIGVGFEVQIVESVPCNERDQSVDFIVTEDRVLDLRKNDSGETK